MRTSYEECGAEVTELLAKVIDQHHTRLAGVRIDAVFAERSGKFGPMPAIKRHGYPAAAKIQIASLEDRARGMADAKLTIDRSAWEPMATTRRRALLDHELTHLMRRMTKKGEATDDLGRPLLKIRPHDFELGFFKEVAERHGEAAPEVREAQRFVEEYGQFCMFPPDALQKSKKPSNGRTAKAESSTPA